jgi:hypothetical protein
MGCGGAEEEAVSKLLRPLKNNNRLRHLSIIASNRSSTPRSRNRRSICRCFADFYKLVGRPKFLAGLGLCSLNCRFAFVRLKCCWV